MATAKALTVLKMFLFINIMNITRAFVYAPHNNNNDNKLAEYLKKRSYLIKSEEAQMVGSHLQLNWKELIVDAILKRYKNKEFENGVENPHTFAPSIHFFLAKPLIERSLVFKFLKKMPKGALLHGHNSAMISSAWIIKNLTYHQDVLKCTRYNGIAIFTFRRNIASHNCTTEYVRIVDERSASDNVEEYDNALERNINLYTPDPLVEYSDINQVWSKFQLMFDSIRDLLSYEETFVPVYNQLMQEMYDDNIMYAEIRTGLGSIYHKDGRISNKTESVLLLKQAITNFKKLHPDFLGMKIIYSVSRNIINGVDTTIDEYNQLRSNNPELIIGFDFNGQEDMGTPLLNLTSKLVPIADHTTFFFHAGETNWNGYSSDDNLIDAILMNTSRIGHGFSLYKHPLLMNIVKQRQICIEVCPISNQVLKLITDMRNHPATNFVAQNVPFVISNDDPGFWNAKGISYDFYYGFMGFTSKDSGLRFLKQLILNSFRCSKLNIYERHKAANIFNNKWEIFLDTIINNDRLMMDV